ncbi:hypothetical protein NP493_789g01003 [Ridgeia piscesae]|uniref:Uncharacterized protein n=1 Tax=Ridgeia piscesae TaxID=27915 RepID=A0AAD9KNM3_RIDPI|nr:hypothetical protein NP493_789g01003 [Ridgeia piscesae]
MVLHIYEPLPVEARLNPYYRLAQAEGDEETEAGEESDDEARARLTGAAHEAAIDGRARRSRPVARLVVVLVQLITQTQVLQRKTVDEVSGQWRRCTGEHRRNSAKVTILMASSAWSSQRKTQQKGRACSSFVVGTESQQYTRVLFLGVEKNLFRTSPLDNALCSSPRGTWWPYYSTTPVSVCNRYIKTTLTTTSEFLRAIPPMLPSDKTCEPLDMKAQQTTVNGREMSGYRLRSLRGDLRSTTGRRLLRTVSMLSPLVIAAPGPACVGESRGRGDQLLNGHEIGGGSRPVCPCYTWSTFLALDDVLVIILFIRFRVAKRSRFIFAITLPLGSHTEKFRGCKTPTCF